MHVFSTRSLPVVFIFPQQLTSPFFLYTWWNLSCLSVSVHRYSGISLLSGNICLALNLAECSAKQNVDCCSDPFNTRAVERSLMAAFGRSGVERAKQTYASRSCSSQTHRKVHRVLITSSPWLLCHIWFSFPSHLFLVWLLTLASHQSYPNRTFFFIDFSCLVPVFPEFSLCDEICNDCYFVWRSDRKDLNDLTELQQE